MVCKLLINQQTKPPSKYKKFLKENETVNGEITKIIFKLENFGDEPSPESYLNYTFKTSCGLAEFSRTPMDKKIAPLNPTEKISLEYDIVFDSPGIWFSTIKLTNFNKKAGKTIEYYRSKDDSANKNEWMRATYVADRHQLDVLTQLKTLAKRKR